LNYHQALTTLHLPDPPAPHEVKKAYRKLALQYHPDKNPDDQTSVSQFRLCTEAYNYLISHSDQWISKQEAPLKVSPAVEDFDDIFDDIFGFSRSERILGFEEPQILSITLAELLEGVSKKIRLVVFERCSSCKGLGAAKNSHATICTYCFGGGRISVSGAPGVAL
jgi:molecular chaperone DnaJ